MNDMYVILSEPEGPREGSAVAFSDSCGSAL